MFLHGKMAEVDRLNYLSDLLSDGVSSCMRMARLVFVNLRNVALALFDYRLKIKAARHA